MSGAAGWQLRLLDNFGLSGPDGPVALTARKAIAVIAYLALQREHVARRDAVATLLWEDVETPQALMNLRQALTAVRRAGPADRPLILADQSTLRLSPAIEIDSDRFEALERGDAADRQAAAALFRTELLAGLTVRDAPAFNEWLAIAQAHWRQRLIALLMEIMDEADDEAGDRNAAITAGLRLLSIDPYNEAAHRTLMRTYARQGRSALAVTQYRSLSDLLRRELRVAPEVQTQQLYRAVQEGRRDGRLPAEAPAPADGAPAFATIATGPARIAVVDDEPELREAIAAYLRGQGLDAIECAGGADLDEALKEGGIDLVLLDVTMPGENGFDVARRLGSAVPKIMLTARSDLIDRVVGLELGADDYIAKPFQLREVLARVRAVLRRTGRAGGVAASP